jgi:glucosamine--fructose-6-phosphate aminotransferase (isomerizing)
MCGIFGLIASAPDKVPASTLGHLVRKLFEQSETRGKDAAGVVAVNDEQILTYKEARRATLMLKSRHFADVLAQAKRIYGEGKAFVIAGHTRMVTNGTEDNEDNNQPVIKDEVVLLHNGIIVNDLALWQSHPTWQRQYQVDTEVFADLLMTKMRAGQSMLAAMQQAFVATKGANTIAAIHAGQEAMVLGTTNGSLYFWTAPTLSLSLFGSERYILDQALQMLAGLLPEGMPAIHQVRPQTLLSLSLRQGTAQVLTADSLPAEAPAAGALRQIRQLHEALPSALGRVRPVSNVYADIERHMHYDPHGIAALKRCSKCLLPETFPFIEYGAEGVCQFCRQHRPTPLRGAGALRQLADQARRGNGQGDCLVPISGGRDSCYGLHYIKKELGLNPVAYTYDWGFVTDLARRNISRMCGELNIEHVLVAANIKQKRENVRKNVTAWLARPALSMIPLFMAGDKAFFYYASMVKKQMSLGPILFSMNWLEKTGFKTGFAGVNDTASHEKTYGLTPLNQLKLISHYGYNFLSNPRYINRSIPDTLFGYLSYYLQDKDYYSIFDFLTWDQGEIERSIIGGYDWETSPDTKSTWRIGDGTAPFYNYIYLTIAGFSEHDTFRSNQIREGMIDRATALQAIEEENQPRVESFKWYCDTVGLDAIAALKAINSAKKLYARQ